MHKSLNKKDYKHHIIVIVLEKYIASYIGGIKNWVHGFWHFITSTEVDTDVIHVIKWTRPSPSVFAYCKRSKTGRWEGLGTRLGVSYLPVPALWKEMLIIPTNKKLSQMK